ncbi:jg24431 [Pararge aegeria aegeria]|uniref:Jg24431 protein n=1 Tax=Pararge aegeria aegeria TaxID=348720 RepID=A0A8S4S405_9NEOP|nr:jg24431 [Pararge aegeria aegeria]
MGGAHSSENRWTLGSQGAGHPAQVIAAYVGPQQGGQMRRVAGSFWRQAAQDRGLWNCLQKTYIQHWTSIG